jgi:hypothetical protein
MQTRFTAKLTEPELDDVRRMGRSKTYWPKLLAKNWYGVGIICVMTWATISGLTGRTHPNWRGIAVIWLVLAGIVGWVFYSAKKSMAKGSARLNAALPDTLTIDNSGVKLEFPAGPPHFILGKASAVGGKESASSC